VSCILVAMAQLDYPFREGWIDVTGWLIIAKALWRSRVRARHGRSPTREQLAAPTRLYETTANPATDGRQSFTPEPAPPS
jgi:hypothetical protein